MFSRRLRTFVSIIVVGIISACSISTARTNQPVLLSTHKNGHLEAINPSPLLTNDFFITYDENTFEEVPGLGVSVKPEKIREAQRALESQPAKNDLHGGWGEPFNGYQLSLRFEKHSFAPGEVISAIILFRNITNHDLEMPTDLPSYDTDIIVHDGQGKLIQPKNPDDQRPFQGVIRSPKNCVVPPGMQKEYKVNLAQIYSFSPTNRYTVQINFAANPTNFQARASSRKVMITRL